MFQPSANLDSTTIIPTHFVKYRQAPWSSLHKTLLRTISKFRKEKENSVDAMQQKKKAISFRIRAVTAKKYTKKRDARAESFCLPY